ncbi:uncharacterized protein EV422DRAFT_519225 [Fimicolochytrium jonesii]|uniref:uncharacterized protein n=1 Tax=Fimicolochytrium jonesii TaxID=1396493 RepID=UPI0022FF203E|nr:uncharacterized protein EV422DRAFT_519225 [Fimicolochytrium jonesii]KAI8824186.1 hypothetical protein EV422DRAFT_519225 [Fimicolochytrium jonesii]
MSDVSGNEIEKGTHVAWNWGNAHAQGHVKEISEEKLEKTIKGKHITRNGTEDNPALFIENDKKGGNPVVKKASEVHVIDGEDVPSNEKVETRRQQES